MGKKNTNIELYTLKWCPYCRRVKALLNSKGVHYKEYNIDDDEELKQKMAELTDGDKSVPQVIVDGKYLGDYDKFEALEASGELNKILGLPTKPFDYDKVWDLIIIGAGPSGLSAAIYAARKGLDFCLVSGDLGGQVVETDIVDNYTGFIESTGPSLIQSFWKHVNKYKAQVLFGHTVTEMDVSDSVKIIQTDKGKNIRGLSIIIAAGTHKRRLGIPGEKELNGNGVSYCAICDGPLFEGRPVAIIGGGNSGLESALDMEKLNSKVSLIEIGEGLKGDKVLIDKVEKSDNIDVYTSHKAIEIKGKGKVKSLIIEDTKTGTTEELNVDGVFIQVGLIPNTDFDKSYLDKNPIQVGLIPNTDFVKNLIKTNERKEIITDEDNKTNVEGIFAAGDITDVKYKQIMIAAAEGVKAALTANEYVGSIK